VVEWVAAGIDSKNVWSFRCFLAKITSLVNNVKRNTYYQFNRVKGGSMKLKLASSLTGTNMIIYTESSYN